MSSLLFIDILWYMKEVSDKTKKFFNLKTSHCSRTTQNNFHLSLRFLRLKYGTFTMKSIQRCEEWFLNFFFFHANDIISPDSRIYGVGKPCLCVKYVDIIIIQNKSYHNDTKKKINETLLFSNIFSIG